MSAWNPNVPHCSKEARIRDDAGNDGGGHLQCLTELRADGSCPNEEAHHDLYLRSLRSPTDSTPPGW
jgi:hypothetical protein